MTGPPRMKPRETSLLGLCCLHTRPLLTLMLTVHDKSSGALTTTTVLRVDPTRLAAIAHHRQLRPPRTTAPAKAPMGTNRTTSTHARARKKEGLLLSFATSSKTTASRLQSFFVKPASLTPTGTSYKETHAFLVESRIVSKDPKLPVGETPKPHPKNFARPNAGRVSFCAICGH